MIRWPMAHLINKDTLSYPKPTKLSRPWVAWIIFIMGKWRPFCMVWRHSNNLQIPNINFFMTIFYIFFFGKSAQLLNLKCIPDIFNKKFKGRVWLNTNSIMSWYWPHDFHYSFFLFYFRRRRIYDFPEQQFIILSSPTSRKVSSLSPFRPFRMERNIRNYSSFYLYCYYIRALFPTYETALKNISKF